MLCKAIVPLLFGLYLLALAVLLVGTFGLFGQTKDPLSGVFLIPLGLPWNRALSSAPEALLPWIGALAPLINIGLLAMLCRWFASRGG